jgi:ADP-ribosyl-[dinitrogen reductase] hydrolase
MNNRWIPTSQRSPRVLSIKGTAKNQGRGGYVVESLEAALWAFSRSDSFREGALLAVNLGDDADTTGAVYGQIGGAFHGAEQIPPEWRIKLAMHEFVEEKADQLFSEASKSN